MAAITVKNIFVNVCPKTNLGYIKIIKIGEKNAATERGAESLTASEIASLMDKNAQAYYNIGEYWYIVV